MTTSETEGDHFPRKCRGKGLEVTMPASRLRKVGLPCLLLLSALSLWSGCATSDENDKKATLNPRQYLDGLSPWERRTAEHDLEREAAGGKR